MFARIVTLIILLISTSVSADDFYVNHDRTVVDLHSGIIWQGNSSLASSAVSALEICEKSELSDLNNWRLPTNSELVDLSSRIHSVNPALYWAVDDSDGQEGIFCFGDGASFSVITKLDANVRCVAPNPYAAVVEAVHKWAESWQNGDVDSYIASYVYDFRPQSGITYSDWIVQRKRRLDKAGSITINLRTEEIDPINKQQVAIVFRQDYISRAYQDSVRKRLLFSRQQGRWLITREEQLASLPNLRLSATSSDYR